jgi:hypothetical protein
LKSLYANNFQKWKETDSGKEEIHQHRNHENYFKLKLAPENLSKITKDNLIELYKNLWTSQIWGNKDWNINRIIDKNGFDNLKNELYQLLYGNKSFEERYYTFRNKIKGFGISILSEILIVPCLQQSPGSPLQ